MSTLRLSAGIAALVAVLAIPVHAGMSQIISTAGCHTEFKNNKAMGDSCADCVKHGGKFKKGPKNAWSCAR